MDVKGRLRWGLRINLKLRGTCLRLASRGRRLLEWTRNFEMNLLASARGWSRFGLGRMGAFWNGRNLTKNWNRTIVMFRIFWGLYPGDEISLGGTPDLAAAAAKTLLARGDNSLGWSYAFKALLWARLRDGDHAWNLVRGALSPVVTQDIHYDDGGGVYPNMFDACPPFQIDAKFGVPAAHCGDVASESGWRD